MYVVIEMQNGVVGNHAWVYDTREDAEVKEYQTLAEVVKSDIPVHTVLLLSDEGFELDRKCYKHDAQLEPEPETEAE